MSEQYSTVLTSEFEGMKARIAELEAACEQLRRDDAEASQRAHRLEARWEKLREWAESREHWDSSTICEMLRGPEREAPDGAECKDFCCPKCGSPYFGRDVVEGEDGKPMVLETVRCHGDSSGPKIYGKCDWRGVWPPEAKDGGE